jgi:hypothetical protein
MKERLDAGGQAYDIRQNRDVRTRDKGNSNECVQSPIIRASTRNACYDSKAEGFF